MLAKPTTSGHKLCGEVTCIFIIYYLFCLIFTPPIVNEQGDPKAMYKKLRAGVILH